MDDEELQAIRAQRMAQLQNQYGVSCLYSVLSAQTRSIAHFLWYYINDLPQEATVWSAEKLSTHERYMLQHDLSFWNL